MNPLYMGEVEGELDFVSAYFLEKQRITMNNAMNTTGSIFTDTRY